MELSHSVKEYLDYLVSDDNNDGVLIYGSFATGRATTTSDLDILVITKDDSAYQKCLVIDDLKLEMFFYDIGYAVSDIISGLFKNNSYYESVINRNIVLKNKNNVVEYLKNHLDREKKQIIKIKREITPRMKYLLNKHYQGFIQENDLYDYFNLLDQIRMTLAHVNNLSSLNIGKVYEMYSDPLHAECDYYLTLPDEEFIAHFDDAIRSPLEKEKIDLLFDSIKFNPIIDLREIGYFKYSNNRRNSILIHMDKMVNKAIKMLIENNPYKDYVYHVVINHLYRFYDEIYNGVTEEFIKIMESAKQENDTIMRIEYLKQLFVLLEGKYAFDYKNYTLYLN